MKIAVHLAVPPEVWFKWRKSQRIECIAKFKLMSVIEGTLQHLGLQESLPRGGSLCSWRRCTYASQLPVSYSKATYKKMAQVKFEVASKSAKYRRVQCTIHASHVLCRCPSFKSDKVCKHTVAVAKKSEILRQHLGDICKEQGQKGASRTALAEVFVNKSVAEKKGSTNKFHYHLHNANCSTENAIQS